jgi:hypothetical protein
MKESKIEDIFEGENKRPEVKELFKNLEKELPNLEKLLQECRSHWGYEDPVYRFYHQSHKVYRLQETTMEIVESLQALSPDTKLNEWFFAIIKEGTGKEFKKEDNERWLEVTRPILEAFFHARYFLEMAVKYVRELKHPPDRLPSGWASLLHLYNLR